MGQHSLRVSRRKFLQAAAMTSVAAVVAACTKTPTPAPTPVPTQAAAAATKTPVPPTAVPPTAVPPTAAPTAVPAPKKAAEQTIRIASVGGILGGFYPAVFGTDNRYVMEYVWTPPLIRDEKHNLQPGLLSGYEPNADGTVWTLKVDPKARWSDGSKLTALDIKQGWEANNDIIDPKSGFVTLQVFEDMSCGNIKGHAEYRAGTAKEITGIKVVNDETLTVEMTMTDFAFPAKLALPTMSILKAEQYRKDRMISSKPECLTNGPFRFTKYDWDGKQYELGPNPNWWKDKPNINKIRFLDGVEESTLLTMWKNNEIDFGVGLPMKEMMSGAEKDTAVTYPYSGMANGIFLNLTAAPTDDINIRKALLHSLDMKSAVLALNPYGAPAQGIIPTELPCWSGKEYTYEYNVEQAKKDIAASRYGSADKVPKMTIVQWAGKIPIFENFVDQWSKVGLRVEISDDTNVVGVTEPTTKQYNMCYTSVGAIIPDPLLFMKTILNTMKPGGFYDIQTHFDPTTLQGVLSKADGLRLDDPTRCAAVQAVEKALLDNWFIEPIDRVHYVYFVKPWVKNWKPNCDLSCYTLPSTVYVVEH